MKNEIERILFDEIKQFYNGKLPDIKVLRRDITQYMRKKESYKPIPFSPWEDIPLYEKLIKMEKQQLRNDFEEAYRNQIKDEVKELTKLSPFMGFKNEAKGKNSFFTITTVFEDINNTSVHVERVGNEIKPITINDAKRSLFVRNNLYFQSVGNQKVVDCINFSINAHVLPVYLSATEIQQPKKISPYIAALVDGYLGKSRVESAIFALNLRRADNEFLDNFNADLMRKIRPFSKFINFFCFLNLMCIIIPGMPVDCLLAFIDSLDFDLPYRTQVGNNKYSKFNNLIRKINPLHCLEHNQDLIHITFENMPITNNNSYEDLAILIGNNLGIETVLLRRFSTREQIKRTFDLRILYYYNNYYLRLL